MTTGTRDLVEWEDPQGSPLSYPGTLPDRPAMLVAGGSLLDIRPDRAPLGDWEVQFGGGRRLDVVLREEGQAPIGARQPVLAVGSNASPAQLHRKFRDAGLRVYVPLTSVRVEGLMAGVSAHVSRPGYIPATPVPSPAVTSSMFITWLDDAQIAAMDLTEPNYRRVPLPEGHAVTFPGGSVVDGCEVYVSRHGYLVDVNGSPRRAAAQETLITGLLSDIPALTATAGNSPSEWAARCQDPDVRERVQVLLRDSGLVRESGLGI